MIEKKLILKKFFICAILIIIFLLFSIPTLPKYTHTAFDSGVFLYSGQQLLNGKIMYKDFYEVKPPVIFLINAVGLSFDIGRLGVWLLEFILLAIAILYFFNSIFKIGKLWPAFLTSLILVILLRTPEILSYGNLSEVYSTGFIILLLTFSINNFPSDKNYKWIIAGILSSVIFLTKQSTISMIIAVFFVLVVRLIIEKNKKNVLLKIIFFIVGIIISILSLLAILLSFGILKDFLDCVFKYTLAYASNSAIGFLSTIKIMIVSIFVNYNLGNLLIISIISAILFLTIKNVNIRENSSLKNLSILVLFGLPIELILIASPGKFFNHYFYPMIPYLAIGFFIFIFFIFENFVQKRTNFQKLLIVILIFFFTGMQFSLYAVAKEYKKLINFNRSEFLHANYNQYKNDEDKTALFLKDLSKDKSIFFWGGEPKYYFLTGKTSAVKFVPLFPIFNEKYFTENNFMEFFNKFKNNLPELIFDASYDYNEIPPLNRNDRNNSPLNTNSKILEPFYKFIEQNYKVKDLNVPLHDKWVVYSLK